MAVNNSRSMNAEFRQGSIDETYIQLTPDRAVVEHPPIERFGWPRYEHVEQWPDDPFLEGHMVRAGLPREVKTTGDGDTRF